MSKTHTKPPILSTDKDEFKFGKLCAMKVARMVWMEEAKYVHGEKIVSLSISISWPWLEFVTLTPIYNDA